MSESDEEHDTTLRLEDILVFITGADCVPPMGFKTAPKIHFSHSSLKLAVASTCAPSITLPTCHCYSVLSMCCCCGNSWFTFCMLLWCSFLCVVAVATRFTFCMVLWCTFYVLLLWQLMVYFLFVLQQVGTLFMLLKKIGIYSVCVLL